MVDLGVCGGQFVDAFWVICGSFHEVLNENIFSTTYLIGNACALSRGDDLVPLSDSVPHTAKTHLIGNALVLSHGDDLVPMLGNAPHATTYLN